MTRGSVLITGGAGFIGSALVRQLMEKSESSITVVDKLTYSSSCESLVDFNGDPRFRFIKSDITDTEKMGSILREICPSRVFHLAAETHVDRSIDSPSPFIHANIVGSFSLLEAVRGYLSNTNFHTPFRFIHVSTDEVYGSCEKDEKSNLQSPYKPNSPYAASKAASDHLVRAWHATFGLPAIVTHCSNNYGPFQYPEKLIPLFLYRALAGKTLPLYGDGQQSRDWLHVDDHCRALLCAAERGQPGKQYNIAAENELSNIELVDKLCSILDEIHPRPDNKSYREQISFVEDRPGHDRRYALDGKDARRKLNWNPLVAFECGLRDTIQWYLDHADWSNRMLSRSGYRGERLGLVHYQTGESCDD